MNGAVCVLLSLMASDALSAAFGAKWKEVLGNVSDGVIVMDNERQLQFANRRAKKLLGFKEGEQWKKKDDRGNEHELPLSSLFFSIRDAESGVILFVSDHSSYAGSCRKGKFSM